MGMIHAVEEAGAVHHTAAPCRVVAVAGASFRHRPVVRIHSWEAEEVVDHTLAAVEGEEVVGEADNCRSLLQDYHCCTWQHWDCCSRRYPAVVEGWTTVVAAALLPAP